MGMSAGVVGMGKLVGSGAARAVPMAAGRCCCRIRQPDGTAPQGLKIKAQ